MARCELVTRPSLVLNVPGILTDLLGIFNIQNEARHRFAIFPCVAPVSIVRVSSYFFLLSMPLIDDLLERDRRRA